MTSSTHQQIALRNRNGTSRVKDENATSKFTRENTKITTAGGVRPPSSKEFAGVAGVKTVLANARPALNEVTTVNVNRKVCRAMSHATWLG
jgi:hypothetical protein